MLAGRAESPARTEDALGWEIFGNRAIRQGNWKLRWQIRPFGKGDWELFDLAADPAERKDLAAEQPEKLKQMVALWDDYARANDVILPSRAPFETLEKRCRSASRSQPGLPAAHPKRQFVPPADMIAAPKK